MSVWSGAGLSGTISVVAWIGLVSSAALYLALW
jgi:hypothetical protein